MVRHRGNIFVAKWCPSGEPGTPGTPWALYEELYDHSPDQRNLKVVAYLPTWRRAENFPYGDTSRYSSLTHVIISFVMFDSVDLKPTAPRLNSDTVNHVKAILPQVLSATKSLGVKVMVAVGGATDYAFLDLMTEIGKAGNTDLLENSASLISKFVIDNEFDGVDLDLECWWGSNGEQDKGGRKKDDGPHPAGKCLTSFAEHLRRLLPKKIISAAVFATSWYGNNYDPEMWRILDWIGTMTYDLTGSWNKSPVGPHTALRVIRDQAIYEDEQHGDWPVGRTENPINSVEGSLWYWTNPCYVDWLGQGANIPSRQKILLGVPTYGYDFAFPKDADDNGKTPPGYKVVRYKDIVDNFPNTATNSNGGNIKVDGNMPHPSFTGDSGQYPYAHNIYYETPGSAIEKLEFVKRAGCGGVIIWELTNDTTGPGSIIDSISTNTGNSKRDNGWVFWHKDEHIYMGYIEAEHVHDETDPGWDRPVPRGLSWVAYDYVGKELNKWMHVGWEFVETDIGLVCQEAIRRVVQDGVPCNTICIRAPKSNALKLMDDDIDKYIAPGQIMHAKVRRVSEIRLQMNLVTEKCQYRKSAGNILMRLHLVQPLHNTRTDRQSDTFKRGESFWAKFGRQMLDQLESEQVITISMDMCNQEMHSGSPMKIATSAVWEYKNKWVQSSQVEWGITLEGVGRTLALRLMCEANGIPLRQVRVEFLHFPIEWQKFDELSEICRKYYKNIWSDWPLECGACDGGDPKCFSCKGD